MGLTTATELESDFYRCEFRLTLDYLRAPIKQQHFMDGCIAGGVLATHCIPPLTSDTLNAFEPVTNKKWHHKLYDEEKRALRGVNMEPFATGFSVGFYLESWVRAQGLFFSREKLAPHVSALTQIIENTPAIILPREIFAKTARVSRFEPDYEENKRRKEFIAKLSCN